MSAGVEHHHGGRLVEAVERYSRVIELCADYGGAWRMLGVIALQSGDTIAARRLLERAIRIDADDAGALCALGHVCESEGRLELAYDAYAAATAIDPTAPAAAGLSRVALGLGRVNEALQCADAAVVANGSVDAALLRALGAARLSVRDYAGSVAALLGSLEVTEHADAYANLGAAYVHLNRVDAAISACETALTVDPGHANAANSLGIARKAQGAFPAAVAAFERAIALGSEAAHVNLGTTLLLRGQYRAGWPHFGWMRAEPSAAPALAACRLWDGAQAPGRRLVICPEQGVGDTIQMVRFARWARARVGSITLVCPPGTLDLLRTADGIDAVLDSREPVNWSDFDLWLPTIRLPVVFDVALDAIPTAPYLRADPARIARFRPRLDVAALRVGLVWSGSSDFVWNAVRSPGLAQLERLGEVPGIAWFALQQGPARSEQAASPMQLEPINADVSDFADTAAIIVQLDLVIAADTSVVHLAGALGRPAWVLLSDWPDWRWQSAGEFSPWYPTLRLFRQRVHGEWEPVVAEVAARLAGLTR